MSPRRPPSSRGCASGATRTGYCSSWTRCSAASGAPGGCGPRHSGVSPDILVMAKGIGSDPAALCRLDDRRDRRRTLPGTLGGTAPATRSRAPPRSRRSTCWRRSGSSRTRARGDQLLDGLRARAGAHPDLIRDVRGVGLMIGLELGAPAGAAAALSRRCAAEQKLLLLPTSVFEVVRMIPPLTVSEECDDALARLGALAS